VGANDKVVDYLQVFQGKDGWYVHEKSNNGDIINSSQPYNDKGIAVEAADKLSNQLGVSVVVKGSDE
jgi:hypothetical protein